MDPLNPEPRSETILVIDDDPQLLRLVATTLRFNGFDVETALDGETGLEAARQLQPALVLLDIELENGLDGYETCRRLKAESTTDGAAVVFMTGFARTADKVQGFELGAVDYITKPFDHSELLARLRTHLHVQRLQRNLATANAKLSRAYDTLRGVFGRFVSAEIVSQVLEAPHGLDLGGQEREVSLLTSDLRGFTRLCEHLAPSEVMTLLNRYLERMLAEVDASQGIVLEIVGDALFVLFGAPLSLPNHAEAAIACALRMQLALNAFNEEGAASGQPVLEMGIGIHSGNAVVGNLGSAQRTKYGAVGLGPNLAGRIESCTCGGQVFASQATLDRLSAEVVLGERDSISPKGVEREIAIAEVLALGPPYDLTLPRQVDEWHRARHDQQLNWRMLEDKSLAPGLQSARLLRFSERGAWLDCGSPPARRTNLRLSLPEANGSGRGIVYAKVVEVTGTAFRVRWSQPGSEWLQALARA
ncbi:MAG: adenylate/guanylate cyclase domain-containing protein [Opitutales bacterium]